MQDLIRYIATKFFCVPCTASMKHKRNGQGIQTRTSLWLPPPPWCCSFYLLRSTGVQLLTKKCFQDSWSFSISSLAFHMLVSIFLPFVILWRSCFCPISCGCAINFPSYCMHPGSMFARFFQRISCVCPIK